MNKFTFFKYATLSLILLNLVLLGFIFFGRERHSPPPPRDIKDAAQKEMQLSDEQYQLFRQSAEKHRQAIELFEEQQASLLKIYFLPATAQTDSLVQDSIITRIADIEKEKIEATREHFAEIRSMLKPEQVNGYEAFLRKAIGRILNKNRKGPMPGPPPAGMPPHGE